MPSIKDQSTVEALARAFIANDRKQEQAMIEVGYTKAYARSYCGLMWENPKIKAAIKAIDEKQAEIGNRSVKSLDEMYQVAYDLANKRDQPAAMNGSVTGIARLYGMDKDADSKLDEPKPLSEQELDKLRAMTAQITEDKLEQHHKIGERHAG